MTYYVVTTSSTGIVECAKDFTAMLKSEGALIDKVDLTIDTDSIDIKITDSAGKTYPSQASISTLAKALDVPKSCSPNSNGEMEFKNSAGTVLFTCVYKVPVCPA